MIAIRESINALSNAIAKIERQLEARGDRSNETSQNNNHGDDSVNQNHGEGSGGPTGGIQTRISRLDFPHLNGEDPIGWIYKDEQFFSLSEDNKKGESGASLIPFTRRCPAMVLMV